MLATVAKNFGLVVLTALVTLAGSYFALSAKAVDRTEVRSIIQNESPYNQDRPEIITSLRAFGADITALQIAQARSEEKLNILLRLNGWKPAPKGR